MRLAFVAWFVAVGSCSRPAPPRVARSRPQHPGEKVSTAMTPALSPALEAELATIHDDPAESIGFGDKAYVPYVPNSASALIGSSDPKVTERLVIDARGSGGRVYRLAVLHVLGMRADPTVDAALIALLDDPALRATAAYLLGRVGFKGYPRRARDARAVQVALQRYLDDQTMFEDPFYRRTFRTQDFVLGAYVRVIGPEQFRIPDPTTVDLSGLGLPELTDAERADLLAQAKQLH